MFPREALLACRVRQLPVVRGCPYQVSRYCLWHCLLNIAVRRPSRTSPGWREYLVFLGRRRRGLQQQGTAEAIPEVPSASSYLGEVLQVVLKNRIERCWLKIRCCLEMVRRMAILESYLGFRVILMTESPWPVEACTQETDWMLLPQMEPPRLSSTAADWRWNLRRSRPIRQRC